MTKILRAVGATFAYKMRGTSRPHAKFTGDFGNAIEVIRISDRSLLSVFAKNLEPCNFDFCNTIPPMSGHRQISRSGPKSANTDREFTFAATIPTNLGASQGGRALFADNFDGRALGPWFDKLRRARIAEFGGVPFASRVKSSRRAANIRG